MELVFCETAYGIHELKFHDLHIFNGEFLDLPTTKATKGTRHQLVGAAAYPALITRGLLLIHFTWAANSPVVEISMIAGYNIVASLASTMHSKCLTKVVPYCYHSFNC